MNRGNAELYGDSTTIRPNMHVGDRDLNEVDDTMVEVRRNWSVMLQENFNPISVALEMLQNSSVGTGHSFENFTRLHGRLETAMDIIVEQHYTSFNDAVSIFGDIILNVKRSSEIVGDVHREIAEFRDHVQYKRGAELPAMLSAVKEFKGRIAATRKLDKIKVQITEARRLWERRFFVPAARSLMDCLYDARYLRQTILEDSLINSIYETSRVIDNERDSFFDALLDETQRVIYALDQVHFQQHLAHLILMVPNARSFVAEKFKIIVNEQILSLEKDIDLSLSPDEFTFDPDSNAVVYLRSLVKSAAMLELLPQLLQLISQRIIPQLKSISDIYLKQARKNFLRARITHNKFRFTNSRFFDFNFIQKNLIEDNPSSCIVEETLDSLCSDFFGHLLVIATSIVLIGDCVDRIMKSQCTTIDISGSTNSPLFREQRAKLVVDVPSFFRNCISAIQGEVLSFMQSSIQGSTKTSNWSSDQSERSEILNLNEIEDALSAGLEFDKKTKIERRSAQIQFKFSNVSDEDISLPFGLLNTRSVQSEKVEADARKLANLLVCDPFLPSSSNIDHQQVPFEPSINHIPTISTHYTRFNGYLQQLVAQSSSHFKFELDDSIAERYIFTMYHKEFIPLLKNRVITSIMHLFSARDSLRYSYVYPMNPVLAVGSGSGAMLNCVLSSYKVVIGLLRLYHQMPMGREEIEDIISSVFVHIVDGCRSKYRDIVTSVSDSRESTSYTAISALFASHSDFIDLYKDLFSSHDQTAPHRSLTLKEGLLLEKLKHDRSIHPDEIIFDYRRLRSLLILQRSITLLPWILANGSKSNEALQTKDEAICIYISPDDKLLTSHSNGLSARSKIIELTITAENDSRFHSEFNKFLEDLLELQNKCLWTARIELRTHCLYYLDLAFREGNYCLNSTISSYNDSKSNQKISNDEKINDPNEMDISVEPDAYVMGLASDLVRFEATTSQWLPYKEYHQVMDNLKITLCTILIEDFRHIRSLDTSGCFKLNANVRALEQVLAIITTGGSSLNATDRSPNLSSVSENNPISISARGCDLQAAKDYYKLASVGVDHLIETIPQLRNRFTTHQYQAVFDVLYRGLDAQQGLDDEGANTLRTAYQNQLVRLKYLIEDSSS